MSDGWTMWTQHHDKFRMWLVAEDDFKKAEAAVVARAEVFAIHSYHQLGAEVVHFLKLEPGVVQEWGPADETSIVRPGGTTRGGRYDKFD